MAGEKTYMFAERLNYFNGLFLDDKKFKKEADYHVGVRRYLNYLLFNPGVLYIDEAKEPLKVTRKGVGNTKVVVAPGSAMVRDAARQEASEVTIGENVNEKDREVDLSSPEFGLEDGQTAYIIMKWAEKVESSTGAGADSEEGDQEGMLVTGNDLTREYAVIGVSKGKPGEEDPVVLLAEVTYSSAGLELPKDRRVRGGLRYEILSQDLLDRLVTLEKIKIDPAKAKVKVDDTVQLKAKGVRSDGKEIDLTDEVEWKSSKPSTASVSATGLVTGHKIGKVKITAKYKDKSVQADIEVVSELTLKSVEITPDPVPAIKKDETTDLSAIGTFTDESDAEYTRPLTPDDELTWSSTDETVATVDSTGRVTGVKDGTAQITASAQGKSDTVQVEVTPAVPAPQINPTNPFDPETARVNYFPVRVFGSNFAVDDAQPPAMKLIAVNGEVPDTDVSEVVLVNDGEIHFRVPNITTTLTRIDMRISVSTSGGEALSPEAGPYFRWRPPS